MRRLLPLVPLLLALLSCSGDSPVGPGGLRGLAGAVHGEHWIVFSTGLGIERIRPDGSNRQIVHAGGVRPSLSPDGTKIAFEHFIPGSPTWEILTMDIDGSDVVAISNSPHFDGYPSWSPDGTKIAFRREENDSFTGHIWVMNADGSGQTQLTFGPVDQHPDDFYPTWTPDGTRIVYQSTLDGSPVRQIDLMSVSASGGLPLNLTNTPGMGEVHPDVSPDGAWIVATCARSGSATRYDVCRLPSNGGLTENIRATTDFEYGPAWSPDGQRIAFNGGNPVGLWVMNADGSGAAPIGVRGADLEPDWGQPSSDDPPPPPPDDPECSDEDDNDEDGHVDHPADPGCTGPNDDSESPNPTPPPAVPECKDGIDNDGDGRTDHPGDPGCENRRDATEAPDPAPNTACVKPLREMQERIAASSLPRAFRNVLIRSLKLLEAGCA